MEHKAKDQTLRHHVIAAIEQEQAFCLRAMESEDYDSLSDDEWVELCEKISKRYLRQARQGNE